MRTYIVTARCGHVGKNKMIQKKFAVKAEDGREAAYKARHFPRVLHDLKNAIVSVVEVSQEEFDLQWENNNKDAYFKCTSMSMQRILCSDLHLEVEQRFDEIDKYQVKENRISRVKTKLKKIKCDLHHYSTLEYSY